MKKLAKGIKKITAISLVLVLCVGCGFFAEEETVEPEMAPIRKPEMERMAEPTPTNGPTPTPTPTLVPTQVPLTDMVFMRPSYANVISGSKKLVEERGSFVVSGDSLVVTLPTDDGNGYKWNCIDHNGPEEGVFSASGGDVERVPYTFTSGRYGGKKTAKSEVKAAEEEWRQKKKEAEAEAKAAAAAAAQEQNPEAVPSEDGEVIYEYVEVPATEYYDEETGEYWESEDPYGEEDVYYIDETGEGENQGEVPQDEEGEIVYYVDGGEQQEEQVPEDGNPEGMSFSFTDRKNMNHAVTSPSGKQKGLMLMSADGNSVPEETQEAAPAPVEVTYVYAPSKTQYTFHATGPGTDVFYLEYTKTGESVEKLDSGFVLFLHADEGLAITFDLVWYSFAQCVLAPASIVGNEADQIAEQAAAAEQETAKIYDSCVRDNNTIGAAAPLAEEAYWEIYSTNPSVAEVVSNGGTLFHENFKNYSWDMFSINPLAPGRTTVYFYHRNAGEIAIPRMQVADVTVADDLSLTVHVRRLDLGVEFD